MIFKNLNIASFLGADFYTTHNATFFFFYTISHSTMDYVDTGINFRRKLTIYADIGGV